MKLEISRTTKTKSEILESMIRDGLTDNRPFYLKLKDGSSVNIMLGHWFFEISNDLLICKTKDGQGRVYELSNIVEFYSADA